MTCWGSSVCFQHIFHFLEQTKDTRDNFSSLKFEIKNGKIKFSWKRRQIFTHNKFVKQLKAHPWSVFILLWVLQTVLKQKFYGSTISRKPRFIWCYMRRMEIFLHCSSKGRDGWGGKNFLRRDQKAFKNPYHSIPFLSHSQNSRSHS